MDNRMERLLARLPEELDAVLITSGPNRLYFTGMHSSDGTILALRNAGGYLLIDFRYYERAKKTVSGCEILLQEKLYAQVAELLEKHNARRVGVEGEYMSLADFRVWQQRLPHAELVSLPVLDRELRLLRRIKSAEEIAQIAAAQKIAEAAYAHILGYICPGRTEREIASELLDYAARHGSERPAFDTIVVSGANSALPHGVPTDKPIAVGEFVTMDFGCTVAGYCSDMTRTVAVGEPDEQMRRLYETVLQAQSAALERIRPGAVCQMVDAAARQLIDAAGYPGCFGHGTGHSLGIEIHEPPSFNTVDETVCEPGMVITVEPGIYLEGRFGVRIEDMALVTQAGYENLTHAPKALCIL